MACVASCAVFLEPARRRLEGPCAARPLADCYMPSSNGRLSDRPVIDRAVHMGAIWALEGGHPIPTGTLDVFLFRLVLTGTTGHVLALGREGPV